MTQKRSSSLTVASFAASAIAEMSSPIVVSISCVAGWTVMFSMINLLVNLPGQGLKHLRRGLFELAAGVLRASQPSFFKMHQAANRLSNLQKSVIPLP